MRDEKDRIRVVKNEDFRHREQFSENSDEEFILDSYGEDTGRFEECVFPENEPD